MLESTLAEFLTTALNGYLDDALATLAVAGGAFAVKILIKAASLISLRVSAESQARLEVLVKGAILEAEERIESIAKEKLAEILGEGLRKADLKLAEAIAATRARLPLYLRPFVTEALIERIIHQLLPETGLGTIGKRVENDVTPQ